MFLFVLCNEKKSSDIKITKDWISTKDARTFERYLKEAGLSNSCVRPIGLEFKLDAMLSKTIGMCYPVVSENDKPVLNLNMLINGLRKEYKFDLT
ncbi:MAG: hypothetical protein J5U17_11800 [Candidatus Methanoperedens sp.]|nr:hypothetical protein [Candidatus Methanoperedens sp.]MCE8428562.1 hypothetical protein [Candidatus Methanoperedens sp.]